MSEWNEYKLSEITTKVGSGATPRGGQESYKYDGISLIRSQNVLDFEFSGSGLAFIDNEQASQLSNVKVVEDDILLNITGDSVARVCKVPKSILPARVNQHVSIVRANLTEVIPDYLLYYLLNPQFKKYMLMIASDGATRNALTKAEIEDFDIWVPSISEQKAIASILSSLDSKIDLLRRQNQTLENIAQTLFKSWFIDFEFPDKDGKPYKSSGGRMVESELGEIPEGWEIGTLKDIVSLKKNPIKIVDRDKYSYYLPIDCIDSKTLTISNYEPIEEANSSLISFTTNDILFGAMRSYFHKVAIAPFDGITRTTCFVFRAKKDYLFSYSVLTIFQKETIDYSSQHSKGTTIPYAVWENGLDNMTIVLPKKDILFTFNNAVLPFIKKIPHSFFEIQTLTKTRGTLLPKLMSGQIRVKDL